MKNPRPDQPKSITYQSFEVLYKKFALPLMKFLVKRMGGNQNAAEEIFSQTMFAAWKSYHTFEHKATFFTWICRIALNKMADYYRAQIHEHSIIIAPALEEIAHLEDRNNLSPEEYFVLLELRRSVKECIEMLPEDKKRLLYLRFWKDLSIKAVAEILGVSERSVEGKIYRAKQELKSILSVKHPELAKRHMN